MALRIFYTFTRTRYSDQELIKVSERKILYFRDNKVFLIPARYHLHDRCPTLTLC
jgi:hypothetical protein